MCKVEDLAIFPTNFKHGRINILLQNRNVEKHNVVFHKSERWKTKHNPPEMLNV